MQFEKVASNDVIRGLLRYVDADWALSFSPSDPDQLRRRVEGRGTTSLLVHTLQIECVVDTGILLFPWGYFPKSAWESGSLTLPPVVRAVVRVTDETLEAGVSIPIGADNEWRTIYDEDSGWLRIARSPVLDGTAYMFADSAAIQLKAGEIQSLWLLPFLENQKK